MGFAQQRLCGPHEGSLQTKKNLHENPQVENHKSSNKKLKYEKIKNCFLKKIMWLEFLLKNSPNSIKPDRPALIPCNGNCVFNNENEVYINRQLHYDVSKRNKHKQKAEIETT